MGIASICIHLTSISNLNRQRGPQGRHSFRREKRKCFRKKLVLRVVVLKREGVIKRGGAYRRGFALCFRLHRLTFLGRQRTTNAGVEETAQSRNDGPGAHTYATVRVEGSDA